MVREQYVKEVEIRIKWLGFHDTVGLHECMPEQVDEGECAMEGGLL